LSTIRFTRSKILALKPAPKYYEVSDSQTEALGIGIQPAPSDSKSFKMRFRRPGGKPGNLTLGPFDSSDREACENPVIGQPLTADEARVLAANINLQRANGVDVIAARQANKRRKHVPAEKTFADHVRDYIDQKARPENRCWWDAAHMLGYHFPHRGRGDDAPTIVKGGLSDRWRSRRISEIDGDELFGLVKEAQRDGIPGLGRKSTEPSASRARHFSAALGALFSWLLEERRIKTNPYLGVKRPAKLDPRQHTLNIRTDTRGADELRWFWKATEQMGYPYGPLCQLLLLTACRRGEIARMQWSELTDDLSALRLPSARTKNGLAHVAPMSAPARKILKSIPKRNDGYIFTLNGTNPITNFSVYKAKLDTLMMTEAVRERGPDVVVPDWRVHDLRRSAATGMGGIGIAPHIIEVVLNHSSGFRSGVAGTYNTEPYEKEKRSALDRWGSHVERVVSGAAAKNVVSLRR
jgi:integrase